MAAKRWSNATDCTLCPKVSDRDGKKCVFESTVEVLTLAGKRKSITARRCAYCDTTPCLNCKTRHFPIDTARCSKCGHSLLPGRKGGG